MYAGYEIINIYFLGVTRVWIRKVLFLFLVLSHLKFESVLKNRASKMLPRRGNGVPALIFSTACGENYAY